MKARARRPPQITALLTTAPDAVRTRFARLSGGELIGALARTRPAPATDTPASTTMRTLRRLARRHRILTDEITDIDTELRALTARAAPTMLATKGYGVITTATLLAGAGDNPDRIRTEASFAALCGAAPIPASSGKTNRHRLNRGGDRQANWALHQIALVRLSSDPRTKAYAARLTATGKSRKEILRCPRTRHRPPSTAPACEEGSHGVGAHDVVSAGMTDTGQGVVLGKNGDGGGGGARSRTGRLRGVRPDLGAQRRIHVVDPDSGLNTMGPQEVSHRGHRMMLAVSDLGMGMNIVR